MYGYSKLKTILRFTLVIISIDTIIILQGYQVKMMSESEVAFKPTSAHPRYFWLKKEAEVGLGTAKELNHLITINRGALILEQIRIISIIRIARGQYKEKHIIHLPTNSMMVKSLL